MLLLWVGEVRWRLDGEGLREDGEGGGVRMKKREESFTIYYYIYYI